MLTSENKLNLAREGKLENKASILDVEYNLT